MPQIHAGKSQFCSQARLLHSGAGKILALSASHCQAAAQSITLYDGLSPAAPLLWSIWLRAGGEPIFIQFPTGAPLTFDQGLYVDPSACVVHLITIAA